MYTTKVEEVVVVIIWHQVLMYIHKSPTAVEERDRDGEKYWEEKKTEEMHRYMHRHLPHTRRPLCRQPAASPRAQSKRKVVAEGSGNRDRGEGGVARAAS
jgi:hypothetical protein